MIEQEVMRYRKGAAFDVRDEQERGTVDGATKVQLFAGGVLGRHCALTGQSLGLTLGSWWSLACGLNGDRPFQDFQGTQLRHEAMRERLGFRRYSLITGYCL